MTWYQVQWLAETSGEELVKLLEEIHELAPFDVITISHAPGAIFRPGLEVPEEVVSAVSCRYDDVRRWLPGVIQFDWGAFFLTRGGDLSATARPYTMEALFRSAAEADVTVRALDSSYWGVLTRSEDLANRIAATYVSTVKRAERLEALQHLTG